MASGADALFGVTSLLLSKESGASEIEAAVELALENGIRSSEGIKHLLRYSQPEFLAEPLSQSASFLPPDVSVYSQLPMEAEPGLPTQATAEPASTSEVGSWPDQHTGGDGR